MPVLLADALFFADYVMTSSSIADHEWDRFLVLGIWSRESRTNQLGQRFTLQAVGDCCALGPDVQSRPHRTIAGWR